MLVSVVDACDTMISRDDNILPDSWKHIFAVLESAKMLAC